MTANQFQDDTDSGTAGRELVQHVIRLMRTSSCFGREVCPTPPCACAQSLIDAITAARLPATTQEQPTAAGRLANQIEQHGLMWVASRDATADGIIIKALRATPPVQAPAAKYSEMEPIWQDALEKCAAGVGETVQTTGYLKVVEPWIRNMRGITWPEGSIDELSKLAGQALADREAAARADEREKCANELEKHGHYGSASYLRVNAIRTGKP